MKTILLIGLGRFGRHIVMKLNELKHRCTRGTNKIK